MTEDRDTTDPRTHVLLVGHGTVEDLDDLPAFLANIRQGRPVPPPLVQHVRQRYEAIGGRSPLTSIARRQAELLSARLGLQVHVAMRLWHPYLRDVLAAALDAGATRLVSIPMAPFSVGLYQRSVEDALAEVAGARGAAPPELRRAPPWNEEPALIEVFARAVEAGLTRFDEADRARVTVIATAHSLPTRTLAGGDPYASLVARTAELVAARACPGRPFALAFQSQGATADPWLGPSLEETFARLVAEGVEHALIVPVGFLSDHVETLYDLDIEAQQTAKAAGLRRLERTALPNDAVGLIDALEAVARACLGPAPAG